MSDALQWISALDTRQLIMDGRASALDVTQACLERIERLDPVLKAFTFVDREGALRAARAADAALAAGATPGPLHGVPVAIKDDLWVKDMPATGGSLVFADFRPSVDGAVAERLRAAGAIIIGKTNMPEFAAWPRSKSHVAGEAVNPWDVQRIAGASSGGSAAAVASGMVPIAIGTDGGGSTRIPAALTGLVGLFPTLGRVPVYGSFFYSPVGSAGPMARNVTDAALVQQVIAGPDPRVEHPLTAAAPDVLEGLENAIDGLSVAWSADFGWIPVDQAVMESARDCLDLLARQGARVDAITRRIGHPWGNGMLMSALHKAVAAAGEPEPATGEQPDLSGAQAWLLESACRGQSCFTQPEFMALVTEHRHLLTPPQQCLTRVALTGEEMPSPEELNATMDALFEQYDVVCSPTMATVAPVAPQGWGSAYGDSFMGTHFTFIANAADHPAVSVPCGLVDGMPVGFQIIGRHGDEATVLRVARALEKALPELPRPPVH